MFQISLPLSYPLWFVVSCNWCDIGSIWNTLKVSGSVKFEKPLKVNKPTYCKELCKASMNKRADHIFSSQLSQELQACVADSLTESVLIMLCAWCSRLLIQQLGCLITKGSHLLRNGSNGIGEEQQKSQDQISDKIRHDFCTNQLLHRNFHRRKHRQDEVKHTDLYQLEIFG